MTSDSRFIEGSVEAAGVHKSTVDRLSSGEKKLVSIRSPSKAVDKRPLNGRESEIVAECDLIRAKRLMVPRHAGARPRRESHRLTIILTAGGVVASQSMYLREEAGWA